MLLQVQWDSHLHRYFQVGTTSTSTFFTIWRARVILRAAELQSQNLPDLPFTLFHLASGYGFRDCARNAAVLS